jgi:hypothetical protein
LNTHRRICLLSSRLACARTRLAQAVRHTDRTGTHPAVTAHAAPRARTSPEGHGRWPPLPGGWPERLLCANFAIRKATCDFTLASLHHRTEARRTAISRGSTRLQQRAAPGGRGTPTVAPRPPCRREGGLPTGREGSLRSFTGRTGRTGLPAPRPRTSQAASVRGCPDTPRQGGTGPRSAQPQPAR